VPTVERGLWLPAFCSIEMAGDRPFDRVDVGLFHELEELPRVGRQRLYIATLAFRVQGVERERGLARARQTGDHGEPLARQIELDAL
jgi:hypothetical protein